MALCEPVRSPPMSLDGTVSAAAAAVTTSLVSSSSTSSSATTTTTTTGNASRKSSANSSGLMSGNNNNSSSGNSGNSGTGRSATVNRTFEPDRALNELLAKSGLAAYGDKFADNQIDLAAFVLLKDEDLVGMQIPLGPRIKMKSLIENYGQEEAAVPEGAASQMPEGLTMISLKELVFHEDVGRGSFGAVFRGTWKEKTVAIKKLLTPAYEEASLLGHLRHRNVIQCFGCCIDNTASFCLIFEFAEYNLSQALHRFQVEPSTIVDWALQIATGMNYLHTEAPLVIIHRDLKPANILMSPTEKSARTPSGYTLKISDFGLSRVQDEHAMEKLSTVGTWEYMAPEVIRNEKYTEKADVYSYGVVLWEMLTRQPPYKGLPSLAVAYGVGHGTMNLPIPSTCNVEIASLLDQCWQRTFADRPSFREIMRTMENISHSEFMNVSYGEFIELRTGWNNELVTTFDEFKKETDTLKKREMVLSLAEMRLTERERKVQERELQLTQSLSADLMCWHTLLRFTDDILGVGLSVTRGGPGARSAFQVTKVDLCDEYLSYTAFFKQKIRHSIKRDMVLDYWIPLFICPEHGQRAEQLVEEAILAIITGTVQLGKPVKVKTSVKFQPNLAVAVLSTLVNNAVVGVVRETVHPFKALEMYMAFWRLLVDFIARYPELQASIAKKVKTFAQPEAEEKRSTSKVANLGEFLVLAAVSEVDWSELCATFVDEMMQRAWFWILRYHPEFQNLVYDAEEGLVTFRDVNKDEAFLTSAFDGARRSLRIVMLHVYFLQHIAHPVDKTRDQVVLQYDTMFGQPSARMKDEFETACKEIMAVTTFQEFFRFVNFQDAPSTSTDLSLFLRRTAANALRRGYYSNEQRAIELGYVMVG